MVVSPTNQLLLMHRVQKSSSFPSAHVFPGGNLDKFHETIPGETAPERHIDGPAYRLAAIRETFEESGILLARKKGSAPGSALLELSEAEIDEGRKAVHSSKVRFDEWLDAKDGVADVGESATGCDARKGEWTGVILAWSSAIGGSAPQTLLAMAVAFALDKA